MRMKVMTALCLLVLIAACARQTLTPPPAADVFAAHCASCHGPVGEGDGPVAAAIGVSVPNLRTLSQRNGGQFPTDAVIAYVDGRNMPAAHGSRMMPVWGEVFEATAQIVTGAEGAEPRIEAIVSYLQQLQYP